ncbi:TIGR00725 family protein [Persicimonas caeni]|uniref:TIGR00725 family protein n=1 Tax=Persicimonas caeni TaxID=2292766 RepID=A0A4Y6PV34_PERCE|nr:TIGR00725 family protein [Persicimonas caeni]QDG52110.1 TIGR00725 family protein [Persicimonas caeni]QED33331.1 TIGR00725 family protein [Persicimonas caeni]
MGTIAFVGGMVGDTLDGATHQGLRALKRAERVIFPGDWIGEELRGYFGERLRYGRELTADQVLDAFDGIEEGAVLYAGEPRVFTGRPGQFPSAATLAAQLEAGGHRVQWCTGCSLAQLAIDAAGVSLEVEREDALIVTPPLYGDGRGRHELAQHASTRATLVMLWAEDAGAEAWKILSGSRSRKTRVSIVSRLGMTDEHVHQGELGELEDHFSDLAMPSSIVVQPCPEMRRQRAPSELSETRPNGHRSSRRVAVAVVGSARATATDLANAETLGRELVDRGCTIVTGGLGGIMEAACRGARSSSSYVYGATVGVLPTYEPHDANEHCDIVVASGMNHARNVMVAASADVVAAVGGRAGTLSEIAFAWTLGRPVVAVAAEGWAKELAGRALDDRRDDVIHGPLSPVEAADCCARLGRNRKPERREF